MLIAQAQGDSNEKEKEKERIKTLWTDRIGIDGVLANSTQR